MKRAFLYLLRKFAWIAVTLWVVYTLSFLLMRSVPGGPFSQERKLPEAIQRNFDEKYKLNEPLLVQYRDHLWLALQGDLGLSFRLGDFTVNEVIRQGFPVSAALGIMAITFALMIGLTAGVLSAVNRGSPIDVTLMGTAALGVAVPNFVLASAAVIVFAFWLRWLPAGGWGDVQQLILPAMCLGAPVGAYIARLTRAGMLETLHLDYIRTAYAKGLPERTVVLRHAMRGAMLPVISYLGPATAGVLTGSPVLERIFLIPGMGSHFVEAALQRDYTLSLGLVMVYTALLLVINVFVDVAYALIDPRVKVE